MADFKMPDLNNLMEAAQRMQADLQRVQADLASMKVDATSGGGMVTAVVNGQLELVGLKIDAAVVDPKDVGMLQDLVVAAVSQAIAKAKQLQQSEMAKVTGGLNIPGMPSIG